MTNVAIRNNHCYKFELNWIDCGLTPLSTSEVISWRSVLLAEESGVSLDEDISSTFIQVINEGIYCLSFMPLLTIMSYCVKPL